MKTIDINKAQDYLRLEHDRLMQELVSYSNAWTSGSDELDLFHKKEDVTTQKIEREEQFAKMRRIKKRIAEIDRALEKIESGSYGLCDQCGRRITPARLKVLPQTSFCLNCKAKFIG